MGTSSSGGGPKGRSPLLPNWATGDSGLPDSDDDQNLDGDQNPDGEGNNDRADLDDGSSNDFADTLSTAKGALKRIANGRRGSSFKKAAKEYVSRTGGAKKATYSSSAGISAGSNYVNFIGSIANSGLEQTLRDFDLGDCIGKSTEEVFSRIANKISPIGATNDEAIARMAVMMALDRLYERMIENDQDISKLDQLDEIILKETVIEYVSAYIFRKWIYEAGLALERNELSETDAIELENEMRDFVNEEVRSGLGGFDILTLDITKGKGKEIIKEIFELAYSTLEK